MQQQEPEKILEWLQSSPTLPELCAAYPEDWAVVEGELATLVARGRAGAFNVYLERLAKLGQVAPGRRGGREVIAAQVSAGIRYSMARLAVAAHYRALAAGVKDGKIRFNRLNGYLAQRLLFSEGLVRKPVSLFWFRLLWPLLWQRKFLMPLVQPEGIYCFYSQPLLTALAELIGSRSCLDLAAGDGALARFLAEQGVQITATDDYSWQHAVRYPDWVVKCEAREALRQQAPEVVLCSWPPADNAFERQVFKTQSVQLYIVIGSRHRQAAGNWRDYQAQTTFDFAEDQRLSRLVLPPELDSAVYVFQRKSS